MHLSFPILWLKASRLCRHRRINVELRRQRPFVRAWKSGVCLCEINRELERLSG